MPMKISQPRLGVSASLMAAAAVATPRKMKPMPIQMASNRIEFVRLLKHSTASTREAAPLMNSSARPPPEMCRVKAWKICETPVTSR